MTKGSRVTLVAAAWAIVLLQTAPVFAQAPSPVDQAWADLKPVLEAVQQKRHARALEDALAMKTRVEDTRDFALLEAYYDLMSMAARGAGNEGLRLGGAFQSALVQMRAYGASAQPTASSQVGLARIYDGRKSERALQISAHNALNTIAALRRDQKTYDDIDEDEAIAHGVLANGYERTGRSRMALRHFRASRDIGSRGGLPGEVVEQLGQVIARVEQKVAESGPLEEPVSCAPADDLAKPTVDACIEMADAALLAGEASKAAAILDLLSSKATPQRTPDVLLPAVLARHLHLLENHPAAAPAVVRSVDVLANKLAGAGDMGSATLVSMRTMISLQEAGQYEQSMADLAGHIARRAARNGNEDLAIRLLDLQAVMLRLGGDKAPTPDVKLARDLERALVALDAASFAELNRYEGLSRTYAQVAERLFDTFAKVEFSQLMAMLAAYWDQDRGYVFPAAGAAAELLGRIGLRDPSDLQRQNAVLVWISSESAYRGAEARAIRLTDDIIGRMRRDSAQPSFLAELLLTRANFTQDSQASAKMLREAYALLKTAPGTETTRMRVLLSLAVDLDQTGDFDSALQMVEEAEAISAAMIEPPVQQQTEILKWRADRALREGDLAEATLHAERALKIAADQARKNDYRIIAPAKTLAGLYARAGRMADARALYEKHVFQGDAMALVLGESGAIEHRLSLALLEAFYGPTPKTLDGISDLRQTFRNRASRDKDIDRSLIRAEAFARYGLGDGDKALSAARRAFELREKIETEKARTREDRILLEVMIGSAYLAALEASRAGSSVQ